MSLYTHQRVDMPNIKDFIDAMNASWPVPLTILLACGALPAGDYADLKYLHGLPSWAMGAVFAVGVFAGAVVTIRIIQLIFAEARKPFKKRRRLKAEKAHIAKLNEINAEEVCILVWAAQQNRQAFVDEFSDPRLTPLVAKGFVERIGGAHSALEWPYRIPGHIWTEVKRQLAEEPQPESHGNIFGRGW